jgi:hypothetical protein
MKTKTRKATSPLVRPVRKHTDRKKEERRRSCRKP